MGDSCRRNLLQNNPRAAFIYALSISASLNQRKEYQGALETVVSKAPFLHEAAASLAALYKEQRNYSQAVSMLSSVIEAGYSGCWWTGFRLAL